MKKLKLLMMIFVMLTAVLLVLNCSKKETPTEPKPSNFAVFSNGEFGTGIGYHWNS